MKRGFTLIELLIVITIIGILAAIAVMSYANIQARGRDAKREEDMHTLQNAWEQYYGGNSANYPSSCSISVTYLPSGIPSDPKTGTAYTTISGSSSCSTTSYCFCADLETSAGNSATDCAANGPPSGYTGEFCVKSLQN